MLAGPPGTVDDHRPRWPTASRASSFCFDGTAIAGAGDFYYKLVDTFRLAAQSALHHFHRRQRCHFRERAGARPLPFLLTQPMGWKARPPARSASSPTAMNVASLPRRPCVRSGRIGFVAGDAPADATARREIIAQHILAL